MKASIFIPAIFLVGCASANFNPPTDYVPDTGAADVANVGSATDAANVGSAVDSGGGEATSDAASTLAPETSAETAVDSPTGSLEETGETLTCPVIPQGGNLDCAARGLGLAGPCVSTCGVSTFVYWCDGVTNGDAPANVGSCQKATNVQPGQGQVFCCEQNICSRRQKLDGYCSIGVAYSCPGAKSASPSTRPAGNCTKTSTTDGASDVWCCAS